MEKDLKRTVNYNICFLFVKANDNYIGVGSRVVLRL